jgi:hypothetical protein
MRKCDRRIIIGPDAIVVGAAMLQARIHEFGGVANLLPRIRGVKAQ